VSERYGIGQAYAGLDEALGDDKFDIGLICTPSHLHMHVFIEKPLSLSLDGISDLLRVIKEKGVK